MAPYTIHLFATPPSSISSSVPILRSLSLPPVLLARAYNWIAPSHESSVLADSSRFTLVAVISGNSLSLPSPVLQDLTAGHFAITVEVAEDFKAPEEVGESQLRPDLDIPLVHDNDPHDSDVEFPLTDALRKYFADFTERYSKSVGMLNLLAFQPGTRDRYMKYIEGFLADISPKYGPFPRFVSEVVADSEGEVDGERTWEMAALIQYPDAMAFANMLDDEVYKDLDRKWKVGTVRDNPLLMVVEI